MRKYLVFLLLPLVLHSCGTASRMGRADRPWSYEVENAGVGADGRAVHPDIGLPVRGADVELSREEWYEIYRSAGNRLP